MFLLTLTLTFIGGVLENWSILDRLHLIEVPTIVLVGEFDTMSIECSQVIVDTIKFAFPLVMIPRAAHCKLCDEPELCIKHLAKFLHTCQAAIRSSKVIV